MKFSAKKTTIDCCTYAGRLLGNQASLGELKQSKLSFILGHGRLFLWSMSTCTKQRPTTHPRCSSKLLSKQGRASVNHAWRKHHNIQALITHDFELPTKMENDTHQRNVAYLQGSKIATIICLTTGAPIFRFMRHDNTLVENRANFLSRSNDGCALLLL